MPELMTAPWEDQRKAWWIEVGFGENPRRRSV